MNTIGIRRIPYPYSAMLTICSDLDETPDKYIYQEIAKYLNTDQDTLIGKGLGLEIGNTIYFDMDNNNFAYWNTDDQGREMIRTLIKSGHIDCLHSYGDFADSRGKIEKNINELQNYNCKLKVWVDHSKAPSNLGFDIMYGKGDDTASEVYHADLTTAYGIKYVSRGRVTSIIAQNVSRKFMDLFNKRYPVESSLTIGREATKVLLAQFSNQKYELHKKNRLMRDIKLRSGQKLIEFIRQNPHYNGPGAGATADGIGEVIGKKYLDSLIRKKGFAILYTHLGKIHSYEKPFNDRTTSALRLLSKYEKSNKILVTTTRRLLDYCDAIRKIKVKETICNGRLKVDLLVNDDTIDISGMTFETESKHHVTFTINGTQKIDPVVKRVKNNKTFYILKKWNRLIFPSL